MRLFLLLPFLLGFSIPAIAHNEFNGGCGSHCPGYKGGGVPPSPLDKKTIEEMKKDGLLN